MTRSERLEAHAAKMRERNAAERAAKLQAAMEAGRRAANRKPSSAPKAASEPRISQMQAEVLRRMAAGADLFCSSGGFWVDGPKVLRSEQRTTVVVLKQRGWVEAVQGNERRYTLTARGRVAAILAGVQRVEGHSDVLGDGGRNGGLG